MVAGTRDAARFDQSSFAFDMGAHWRDIVVDDGSRRQAGPYDDVLRTLSRELDPSGVFRGRPGPDEQP